MQITIGKSGSVQATLDAPPSKSYTHRALIIAGLAEGVTTISGQLDADDTRITARALMSLGVKLKWEKDIITVTGTGGHLHSFHEWIDIKDSGTTMRLMTAISLLSDNPVQITGSPRMQERPLWPLVQALNSSGADIRYLKKDGFPPVLIDGELRGGKITIDGSISSQFISSLLIASPFAREQMEIRIQGEPVSQPYILLTLAMMKQFGVDVNNPGEGTYSIPAGQKYQATQYTVEGDYSSASYWFALAAVTKGKITIKRLNPNSLQGDKKLIDILQKMGCEIVWESDEVTITGTDLDGLDVYMGDCPDVIQTLAVVAACARSPTTIHGIHHLRSKESDRVEAIRRGLAELGGEVMVSEDSMTITPVPLHGGTIHAENDHRTAMSFSILGTAIGDITILDAGCVTKSYPEFWKEFKRVWQT